MKINAFSRRQLWILLMLLSYLMLAACAGLKAQPNNDDFDYVKAYRLPENAVPHSELVMQKQVVPPQPADSPLLPVVYSAMHPEELVTYQGKPFTGTSYELYENKQPSRLQTFKDGILHGPSYVWYPNGAPQMYVNYRYGLLNGRFLGWYMHGGVLYDMVINNSGYGGDFIGDDRSAEEGGDSEQDGDAPDKDND